MPLAVITLEEGIGVEVDVAEERVEQVGAMERVSESLEQIGDASRKLIEAVVKRLPDLREVAVEGIEIEYGLSFSGEGTVFVTKVGASTNVKVKVTIKPIAAAPSLTQHV